MVTRQCLGCCTIYKYILLTHNTRGILWMIPCNTNGNTTGNTMTISGYLLGNIRINSEHFDDTGNKKTFKLKEKPWCHPKLNYLEFHE